MSAEKFGSEVRREYLQDAPDDWEDMYETAEQAERGVRHMEHFFSENGLTLDENTKILEVGIGKGHLFSAMKKRGFDVVGVDARPRTEESHKVISARIEQLSFPDEAFDIVLSSGVFDSTVYQHDQSAMIKEIARVLKKDGVLFALGSNWFDEGAAPESVGLHLVSGRNDQNWRGLYRKE